MTQTLLRLDSWLTPQRAFVVLGLFSTACLLLWAELASVDVIVRTEGRIVPAGKSQIIQHLEGGIVRGILVQEGQMVLMGQTLMELSDIQAKSNLGQEKSKRAALLGREARLLAEINGSSVINFPADMKDTDVRQAETDAWRARRAKTAEEVRVLRDQGAQKQGEAAETGTRSQNLKVELGIAKQQLYLIENLRRSNAASELEVLENQARVKRIQTQIAEAESAAPRFKAAQAEMESRVGEVVARFRSEASSELTQVRTELEKSTLEVGSSEDRLFRNSVRAPVSGFINRLAVNTVGGVVRPGEILMEITPDDKRVVLETRAHPNDRANLRKGLPAKIHVGAYDYSTYGSIHGSVTEVSADTLNDEREGRYYRVRIEALPHQTQTLGGAKMVPGMTATADVVVGKRTLLSYVLSPIFKFSDSAFRDPR